MWLRCFFASRRATERRPTAAARTGPGVLAAALLLALGCARSPERPPDAPRLVLLLVSDQFRADYMERFEPLFEAGLARLAAEGRLYTEARHSHALTQTAPGHATLATGANPRRHGIVANRWYDRREREWRPAVDHPEADDPSPRQMLASTLGDWMRRADSRSRAYAAGGKDRSAIFLSGHDANGAFWYSTWSGELETSDYFFADDPQFLEEFNDRRWMDEQLGRPWEPLPVSQEMLERLGISDFDLQPLAGEFPRPFGGASSAPTISFYSDLYSSPWSDDLVGRFGEHLIVSQALGADEHPDYLGLAFSAVDLVGHDYGPDSRELLDTVLRLDRTLGRLFDTVERTVGMEHTLVVFSGDHGVSPVPELRRQRGLPGSRVTAAEAACVQSLERRLDDELGEARWLGPGPFIDRQTAAEAGVALEEVERIAKRSGEACPGVEEVWTRSELVGEPEAAEGYLRLARASFHPERSPDLLIRYREFFLNTRNAAATHGSPYDYDTRVPLVFLGAGVVPGVVRQPATTADVAPTLAARLGVTTPKSLDGRALDLSAPAEAAPPLRSEPPPPALP